MADLNACRICLVHAENEDLTKIYENGVKIASEIFLIADVQIVEFTAFDVPALICGGCLKDLKNAMMFRNRAKTSDKSFFRHHTTDIEENNFYKTLLELKNILKELSSKVEKTENPEAEKLPEGEIDEANNEAPKTENLPASDHETGFDDYGNGFSDDESDYWPEDNQNEKTEVKVDEQKKKTVKKKKIVANKDERFHCQFCPQNFQLKTKLNQHITRTHQDVQELSEIRKFTCKICGMKFQWKNSMTKHLKTIHSVDRQSCSSCEMTFKSKESLRQHENKNHPKEHTCEQCGKVFPNQKPWKIHLKTHSKEKSSLGEESLPCSICAKFFNNISCLRAHEKRHGMIDYYYCDLCPRKAKDKSDLTRHIKDRHLNNVLFYCPNCPQLSFTRKYNRDLHIKSFHHGIREFRCELCGKDFSTRRYLNRHKIIHTGEARFECKYCDRKFVHQTDCRRHEWTHTGYKGNIQCPRCNQRFIKSSDLQSHRCNFQLKL